MLRKLHHTYRYYLYEFEPQSKVRGLGFLLQSFRIFHALLRDLADGQLSLRAMSLVYTTVIAIVPLLAISFSVLKGFGVHNQIEPLLLNLLAPLGEQGVEVTSRIIGFVDNIKVGLLGTVGFAILIYSVVAMMQKIERSINYIWHVTQERSWSKRFSDYLSVLLIGPLLIFLSIGMTTAVTTMPVVERLQDVPAIELLVTLFGRVLPYLILAGAFTFIYIFIPNTKVRIFPAFMGGLMTAVIWKVMGWVFAVFVASSTNTPVIYSAFATIIILMVWIYLGWLMLLIGASIAFYVQYPQNTMVKRHKLILSSRMKERLVIAVAHQFAKDYDENKPSTSQEKLAQTFKVPMRAIELAILLLEESGFFYHVRDRYVPSQPLTKITIEALLNKIAHSGEDAVVSEEKLKLPKEVTSLFTARDQAIEKSFKGKTLRDIL